MSEVGRVGFNLLNFIEKVDHFLSVSNKVGAVDVLFHKNFEKSFAKCQVSFNHLSYKFYCDFGFQDANLIVELLVDLFHSPDLPFHVRLLLTDVPEDFIFG